jgi:hypothetical protein
VEVQRFLERAEQASAGVADHDSDYYAYMLKRTSIDAERALTHLRKCLNGSKIEPVPVPSPESTGGMEVVI